MSNLRYVSDSERGCAGCRHKWLMKHGLRVSTPHKPEAMYRGVIWSYAMDWYHEVGATVASTTTKLRKMMDDHLGQTGPDFMKTMEDTGRIFTDTIGMLERYDAFWGEEELGDRIVFSEKRVASATRTPTGHKSTKTGWLGVLDKLLEIGSDLWVLDHKTTALKIEDWRTYNDYRPQASTYCWLIQETFPNRNVRGIIYDIAHSIPPKLWNEFDVIKDGSRLHKPPRAGMPHTTADQWAKAIAANGFRFDDQPWYITIGKKLRERDRSRYWFDRVVVPIPQSEIERTGRELYTIGSELRLAKDKLRWARSRLRDASVDPNLFAKTLATILQKVGAEHPRNPTQCRLYNRPCDYMPLCREWSVETASSYVMQPRWRNHERSDEPESGQDETADQADASPGGADPESSGS